jgi:hypothetical protein
MEAQTLSPPPANRRFRVPTRKLYERRGEKLGEADGWLAPLHELKAQRSLRYREGRFLSSNAAFRAVFRPDQRPNSAVSVLTLGPSFLSRRPPKRNARNSR